MKKNACFSLLTIKYRVDVSIRMKTPTIGQTRRNLPVQPVYEVSPSARLWTTHDKTNRCSRNVLQNAPKQRCVSHSELKSRYSTGHGTYSPFHI